VPSVVLKLVETVSAEACTLKDLFLLVIVP